MVQYKLWQVGLFYLLLIGVLAYLGYNATKFGIWFMGNLGQDIGAAIGAVLGVLLSLFLFQRFVKGRIQPTFNGYY